MNLKHARYIKAIADYGTVTAAAKALFVSQPSLSQTLHQVEEEIGMPVFDRSSSPMKLTYAGETYLNAAIKIITITEQLENQMKEMKHEHSGRIRLGISVSRGIRLLPKLVPMFKAKYPEVDILLTEAGSAELEELLLKHEIDLALAALEPTNYNIVYALVEKETIGLLAGKDSIIAKNYASGTPLPVTAAKDDLFVSLTREHSSRLVQDKLFSLYNLKPKILIETDSLEICRRLAMESGACMIVPDAYLDEYIQYMGGAFFPIADYETRRHFYACTRKEDYMPQYTRDLVEMVGIILREHPRAAALI